MSSAPLTLLSCSLSQARFKAQGAGPRATLSLRPATRVVWECGSLAGASPALLSAVPVMHLQTYLQVRGACRGGGQRGGRCVHCKGAQEQCRGVWGGLDAVGDVVEGLDLVQ